MRSVDHKIDWHIRWRVFDRGDYCLGILQIDVPGDSEAKKAALLLTMDHRDNTRPVQFFNCADRLGTSNDIPSCRK
jgi:hypothetical protein